MMASTSPLNLRWYSGVFESLDARPRGMSGIEQRASPRVLYLPPMMIRSCCWRFWTIWLTASTNWPMVSVLMPPLALVVKPVSSLTSIMTSLIVSMFGSDGPPSASLRAATARSICSLFFASLSAGSWFFTDTTIFTGE